MDPKSEIAGDDVSVSAQEKQNTAPTVEKTEDVEIASVNEPEKTYYSKLSVWLMVLFSGLAIGSDG